MRDAAQGQRVWHQPCDTHQQDLEEEGDACRVEALPRLLPQGKPVFLCHRRHVREARVSQEGSECLGSP